MGFHIYQSMNASRCMSLCTFILQPVTAETPQGYEYSGKKLSDIKVSTSSCRR